MTTPAASQETIAELITSVLLSESALKALRAAQNEGTSSRIKKLQRLRESLMQSAREQGPSLLSSQAISIDPELQALIDAPTSGL
jgi:hypothetical protein